MRKSLVPLLCLLALGCAKSHEPDYTLEIINQGMLHRDKSQLQEYVDLEKVGPTFADYLWTAVEPEVQRTLAQQSRTTLAEVKAILGQRQDIKGRIVDSIVRKVIPRKPLFGHKPFRVLSVTTEGDKATVKAGLQGVSGLQFDFSLEKQNGKYVLEGISPEYWAYLWPQTDLLPYLPSPQELAGFLNSR